jgi:hypothetical protein
MILRRRMGANIVCAGRDGWEVAIVGLIRG